MQASFTGLRLGRIAGVSIELHYSWLSIAVLVVLSLAGHFHVTNPEWSAAVTWSLAIITTALFFASIVVHELSHAAVAKSKGIPVRSIMLFALGGVAKIERESSDPKSEFWVAFVGPVTSIVLGVIFLLLAAAFGWRPRVGTPALPAEAALVWLGYINIALAVFNMIPAYPLDGGRVLRAIVWSITGNVVHATRIAAGVGQFIGFGFIVLGLLRFFSGAGFGGLWLAFIGWFISQAAGVSSAETQALSALSNVRVRDLMADDCLQVDGNVDLQTFAYDYVLRTGRRCFVVFKGDQDVGLVTVNELKRAPRDRWQSMTVSQIARPIETLTTVSPETEVRQALDLMVHNDVNQLPVVSGGHFSGVISRSNVLQFITTRGELRAA